MGFSYRMNGRPEMISYLFTAIYLFLFQRIYQGENRLMWLFIPLQLLWANLHEGFGVGIVLLIIFCGSLWFNYLTKKIKSEDELKLTTRYTGISILAYLSVSIHPMGATMLGYPYNIFTQLSANQFTSEILSASNASYWQFPAFINVLFMVLSLLWLVKSGRKNGKFSLANLFDGVPLYYLLIYVAFLYLSFKAYRNVPFFLVVSAPLVAKQLGETCLVGLNRRLLFMFQWHCAIGLYLSIVSNAFYSAILPMEEYGIGISPKRNSIGAATFLQQNKITGRAFSDYLGSAYLLWHLQPDFKTFVDLRDLDVFEADDMEIAISCVKYPERKMQDGRTIWEVVDALYQFDYAVVLNHPDFVTFHRTLYSSKNYAAVYADELNTIYLRKTNQNEQLINQFGTQTGNEVWHDLMPLQTSNSAQILSTLFNPLYNVENNEATN